MEYLKQIKYAILDRSDDVDKLIINNIYKTDKKYDEKTIIDFKNKIIFDHFVRSKDIYINYMNKDKVEQKKELTDYIKIDTLLYGNNILMYLLKNSIYCSWRIVDDYIKLDEELDTNTKSTYLLTNVIYDKVKYLIDKGVDIKKFDCMYHALKYTPPLIKLLIKSGIDINAVDKNNETFFSDSDMLEYIINMFKKFEEEEPENKDMYKLDFNFIYHTEKNHKIYFNKYINDDYISTGYQIDIDNFEISLDNYRYPKKLGYLDTLRFIYDFVEDELEDRLKWDSISTYMQKNGKKYKSLIHEGELDKLRDEIELIESYMDE